MTENLEGEPASTASTSRALWGVVAFGFALRAVPILVRRPVGPDLFTDEGIYFSSAALMVRGTAPYRDLVLAQPPGIYAFLAPFTVIGSPTTGLALARVAMALVGAANVYLVGRIAQRFVPPAAAALGALAYALFPLAVVADRELVTEAPQHLFCLLAAAVWLGPRRDPGDDPALDVRRWDRRAVLAGVLVGISVWFRLQGALVFVPLLVTAIGHRRIRDVVLAGCSAVAAWVVLVVPFAAMAPSGFADQVVLAQLGRPANAAGSGLAHRLSSVLSLPSATTTTTPALLATVVLGALVVALVVGRGRELSTRFGLAWYLTAVASMLAARYFSDFYVAVLGPPVGLMAAGVAAWLLAWRPSALVARVARVGLVAALVVAGLQSARLVVNSARADSGRNEAAAELVAQRKGACLGSFDPSWLLMGERLPDPDVGGTMSVEVYWPMAVASREGLERSPGIHAPASIDSLRSLLEDCPAVLTSALTRERYLGPLEPWFLEHFERSSPASELGPELWVRVDR